MPVDNGVAAKTTTADTGLAKRRWWLGGSCMDASHPTRDNDVIPLRH